jgi:hypothetical protein
LSEKDTEKLLEKFNDKVSPWAETYVAKSVEAGLLNGFPDGTFKGSTNATRAQSAVMLLRFLSN